MDKNDWQNSIKSFITSQKGLSVLVLSLNLLAAFVWIWAIYSVIFAPIHIPKEEVPRLTINQQAYDTVQQRLTEISDGYRLPDFTSRYANPEPFSEYSP